uniref:Uncharacterized protein n=1 Tax=Arundo donax TaxID=35708 RepID=A0A0A9D7J8_ARUDO
MVFTFCTAMASTLRCISDFPSWIKDGASTPAFPAEWLVVCDAYQPVAEHCSADSRSSHHMLLFCSCRSLVMILWHNGHLHCLAVAAGDAHSLTSRRPRPNQKPPFHLSSDLCLLPLADVNL